jgi:aminoglycoside phosphotransferase (APT) family kinase protein
MISSWQDRRAIRAILGRDARSESVEDLQRRRNRRTLAFDLEEGAGRYVLKFYRRRALVETESRSLEFINGVKQVRTPRYCGRARRHFIQEFIEGTYLDELSREEPYERFKARCFEAIRVLAGIHTVGSADCDVDWLRNTFAPDLLRARLERARARLEGVGFPRYAELSGKRCDAWSPAISESRIAELTRDLQATQDACVLGHGDFQPRHMIFTATGDIYVVDWVNLSLVTPWYELAHLVRWFRREDHAELVAAYHEEMRRRGRLLELSEACVARLARSALAYERICIAKDLVRKLQTRAGAVHLAAFQSNMDALAEI